MNSDTPKRVAIGEMVAVELPYSEVNMHMRVAGTVRVVRLDSEHGATILRPDGTPWCAPITPGEAGFYRDEAGFYTYPARMEYPGGNYVS